MTSVPDIDQGALVAVSAAFGAGTTAFARMMSGNRRTDKVDAVTAVAAAYDRVAERNGKQLDDVIVRLNRAEERCEYLEREIRKRDQLILEHISGRRAVPPLDDTTEQGTP